MPTILAIADQLRPCSTKPVGGDREGGREGGREKEKGSERENERERSLHCYETGREEEEEPKSKRKNKDRRNKGRETGGGKKRKTAIAGISCPLLSTAPRPVSSK